MLEKYLVKQKFESYEDFINNYELIIPENFNFAYDVVDSWAAADKNKRALLHVDDCDHETSYTFADLKRLSDACVNAFAGLGIGKGDVVMLILKQRAEAWICMLALHKLGAVVIPATYQLMPKDIVYRCNAASVKMIVCVDDRELLDNIAVAAPECKTLEHVGVVGEQVFGKGFVDFRELIRTSSSDFKRPEGAQASKAYDRMLVYFSSGTTGMPKMVAHDYTYPLGHITTAAYWQETRDNTRHLTMSDSGWAKFGWGKIYGQWICGAEIVAYDTEKFVPLKLLKLISRLNLTTFCAPPTVYRFLIKEDLKAYDFSSIKKACTAGEPLNPEVFERFKEATGLEICEGFGQSESSVMLANYPYRPVRPGSIGLPSPLYDIDIVDENGVPCEDGIVGSIVVKNLDKNYPTGLFKQYLGDLAANAAAFKNNMYNTGDTAWRDGDGYYYFVGRSDDIIKCSGYRIGPFEVESALLTHKSVLECAVTAAPDEVRGQVVKATVVLARGYEPSDALKKELQDHVKKITAPYKYPRIVEFVTELPKTISGKIKRGEIRGKG
ncbi:MAG: AMP-binding protein [Firmicutes bacterium]|nr:AMP-binding protein [Bacillota bacterium]